MTGETTERPRLPRRVLVTAGVGVLVLASGLGAALWAVDRSNEAAEDHDRIEALEATAAERGDAVDQLADGLDEARTQLEGLGVEPEVPPPEEVVNGAEARPRGQQGEPGEAGDPPSDEQIEAAVEAYCAANGCTGPAGPEPNSLQVAAAVAAYCDARGECQGPAGETGSAGTDGAAGSDGVDGAPGSDGQRGPGPTDEQIAAAVESYCAARNGCAGPAGADGEDGEDSTVPGPQGPQGEPGPACPGGVEPVEWTVNQARSGVVGLEPGSYLVCPTAGT